KQVPGTGTCLFSPVAPPPLPPPHPPAPGPPRPPHPPPSESSILFPPPSARLLTILTRVLDLSAARLPLLLAPPHSSRPRSRALPRVWRRDRPHRPDRAALDAQITRVDRDLPDHCRGPRPAMVHPHLDPHRQPLLQHTHGRHFPGEPGLRRSEPNVRQAVGNPD